MSLQPNTIWRFDPTSLKLFIAACEEGSIARAAERENMVPSAVSKRIAELEDAVGVPLLYRHQKGIEPTPAGKSLLNHARHVLDELTIMAAELSGFTNGQRGHLRISANRSSIIQFLPQDLSGYRQDHPEIAIDLQEKTSEEAIEAVLTGQADLGIGAGLEAARDKGLLVHAYHKDRLVLLVPVGHALATRPAVRFTDTLAYGHIALHRDSPLYRTLEQAALTTRLPINYRVHVTSFDAVCRMVEADLGVAVIPANAISHRTANEAPGLVGIPLLDDWASRQFNIVSRPEEFLTAISLSFIEFLTARAGVDQPPEP